VSAGTSVASRAVAYLQEHGETRGAALAEALETSSSALAYALRNALDAGDVQRRKEGHAVFFRMRDQEPAGVDSSEPDPIRWCHWDDGDIVIYGLQENEDGSHTIPASVVQALKNRLAWSPAR
jgi:hypothetical protein